jgi:hypothetical protein
LLWKENNADSEEDDDDSMPDLFRRNCDDSSEDSSIPELLNRKSCYDSDSDSDDEAPQDFKMNRYVDMLGMSAYEAEVTIDDILNTGGVEEVFNVDSSTRGHDTVVVPWLLDAGASIHVETREGGVLAEKECHVTVNIADGKSIKPKGTGTKTIYDSKTGCPLKIEKMHVILEFAKRILSVSKLIDDGFKVEYEREQAVIKDQSGKTIKCPRDSKSGLCCMHASESDDIVRASEENSEWKTVAGVENPATVEQKPTVLPKMPTKLDINEAHDILGHKGEALLRKTYNHLDVTLAGALKPCEGCGFAKAKAKAVSKTTSAKATKPGERLFLDTSGPFSPTLNGYKYWIQVVDDFTRYGFCEFNKNKKGMGAFIRKLIEKLRAMGMETKYLRCDNAGEHMKDMLALCDEFAMVLELTAPDTPQMNGVVERRFVILKQRALAMMVSADPVKTIQEKL